MHVGGASDARQCGVFIAVTGASLCMKGRCFSERAGLCGDAERAVNSVVIAFSKFQRGREAGEEAPEAGGHHSRGTTVGHASPRHLEGTALQLPSAGLPARQ